MSRLSIHSIACKAAFGLTLAAAALCAHAAPTLLGDSVSVTLDAPAGFNVDPTPFSFNSTVTVAAGREISVGDGSDVGNAMLPGTGAAGDGESIDFDGSSIALRVLSGEDISATSAVTGYGAGARYVFSGLDFSDAADPTATFAITGISLTLGAGDVTNVSSSWAQILSRDSVSFDLAAMVFALNGGGTTAQNFVIALRVTKDTTPDNGVPEPGSLALAGLALAAVWRTRRGRSLSA